MKRRGSASTRSKTTLFDVSSDFSILLAELSYSHTIEIVSIASDLIMASGHALDGARPWPIERISGGLRP